MLPALIEAATEKQTANFILSCNQTTADYGLTLTPQQAVEALLSSPLSTLFDQGLQLVRRKTDAARRKQRRVANHRLSSPNVYSRATVVDGLSSFFSLYRPQFAAHEIHITADYPVCVDRPQLDGIEFTERYLRCIEAEPNIDLADENRMDDRRYRYLVEHLLQLDSAEEKVRLLLREVHALADLLDALSDSQLDAQGCELLVSLLPLPALAALLVQYPQDDFLSREDERLLYAALQKQQQRLSPEEARQIAQAVAAMQNGGMQMA